MNHWDAAYSAALPLFLGTALWKMHRLGKYRQSLPGMFGANWPAPLPPFKHRIWMHSVSVGETIAASAVAPLLHTRHPDWQLISTTGTETGQAAARERMPEMLAHDFAPADFSFLVRRFLDAYRPSVYLFFETEIWPNTLMECARRGIRIFMINGKLSQSSARSYRKLRWLLRKPLSGVSKFCMQTEEDARRMRAITGDKAPITVTGNVKFDNLPTPLKTNEKDIIRREWGVDKGAFLILAGSTHHGEEREIAEAFLEVRRAAPHARLVIAPRHPERFQSAARDIESAGLTVEFLSKGPAQSRESVLILDRMGVLARSFGAADVALVGGAWNPIGGHNLLEPAAHGIPVIHGPAMHEQKEIMRTVTPLKATLSVKMKSLPKVLKALIGSEKVRKKYAERALQAASANQGAALRSVEILEAELL